MVTLGFKVSTYKLSESESETIIVSIGYYTVPISIKAECILDTKNDLI